MTDSLDNCQQRAQAAKTFIESKMQEFQVLLIVHYCLRIAALPRRPYEGCKICPNAMLSFKPAGQDAKMHGAMPGPCAGVCGTKSY